MNDQQSSRVNQILDLLVEEIEERMRVRREPAPAAGYKSVDRQQPQRWGIVNDDVIVFILLQR